MTGPCYRALRAALEAPAAERAPDRGVAVGKAFLAATFFTAACAAGGTGATGSVAALGGSAWNSSNAA